MYFRLFWKPLKLTVFWGNADTSCKFPWLYIPLPWTGHGPFPWVYLSFLEYPEISLIRGWGETPSHPSTPSSDSSAMGNRCRNILPFGCRTGGTSEQALHEYAGPIRAANYHTGLASITISGPPPLQHDVKPWSASPCSITSPAAAPSYSISQHNTLRWLGAVLLSLPYWLV